MEEDHITCLPDSVMCHILSKLPTKTAVRTSVLSRDWIYKWTSIYDVNIHFNRKLERFESFSCFMDRMLEYTLASVRSFRLSISESEKRTRSSQQMVLDNDQLNNEHDKLDEWLSMVFTTNVENLEIKAPLGWNMDLLRGFGGSCSMRGLSLLFSCTIKLDTHICFPNLKRLCLGGGVVIANEQSPDIGPMFMIFPVLEYLELRECKWVNASSVEIHAPELTKFKAAYSTFEGHPYSISIIGPKLATFELPSALPDNFVIYAPGVAYGVLCYRAPSNLRAHTILKWFLQLQCLRLSEFVVEELVKQREDFSLTPLCELKRLELYPCHYSKKYSELLNPKVLPSLELIVLNLRYLTECDSKYRQLYSPFIEQQLREVKFINYCGSECQKKLVKYFLREGKGLERASIAISSAAAHLTESGVTRNLSLFLPESSTCVLLVHKHDKR